MFLGPPGLILLAAIVGAVGALWASQQQANFEREPREKSEEIARLTRRTLDLVTGGDSFPSLSVFLEDDRNSGMLAIRHLGEHPLYDVTTRVVDLQKAASIKPGPGLMFEAVTAADTYLQIGTLVPSYIASRGRVDLGDVDRGISTSSSSLEMVVSRRTTDWSGSEEAGPRLVEGFAIQTKK